MQQKKKLRDINNVFSYVFGTGCRFTTSELTRGCSILHI